MQASEAIVAAIRAANGAGRPALVAFLTAGFPRKEDFEAQLAAIAAAADVVEIGVPFSDPMADGMTIQRSSRVALAQGVSLAWILETLRARVERPAAPLLLMSYLNPLLAYGLDRLPAAARAAMLEDLERGFVLLVPVGVADGAPGWWRVDPISGATLGRGGDGRGSAFVEYLTSWQVSLVITAGFTGYGVGGCMAISDGFRRGCCIAQNLAMGAVGFGLGYALGAAVTGAAVKVVVFVKMDVQANLIGTLVPPVCGS